MLCEMCGWVGTGAGDAWLPSAHDVSVDGSGWVDALSKGTPQLALTHSPQPISAPICEMQHYERRGLSILRAKCLRDGGLSE